MTCRSGTSTGTCDFDGNGNLFCYVPSNTPVGTSGQINPPSSGSFPPPPSSGNTGNTNIKLINPLQGGGTLQSFTTNILNVVIEIGAIVVIFMLVYVGYLFVAAQGEPGKITSARQALLWTIVGALILLGAKVIALGIQATVQALS